MPNSQLSSLLNLMTMNNSSRIAVLVVMIFAQSKSHATGNDQWIATTSGCMVSASNLIAKTVKVSWTGNCSDGYADGNGVLTWSNGNRYEGELYVGTIRGNGTFYWANGDWYEGEFKNGRREGIGTQHFDCSGQYHGEFHNGVMDGVGALQMADGNRYEGAFHNGVMEGLGVRNFADGSKYEGEFKHNQQEGLGTLVQANQFRYEGEFYGDHPEGHALVTNANGITYEGMYVDGHVDGRGILTKPNGERDVGIFRERKGVMKLVSTLGPQLYEPCQTHCSTTITSCGSNSIAGIAPDDPNYQMKLMNASVTCGREMEQCTSICQRHNPTVVELKGIVEVGELDDPANTTSADNVVHDTKPADTKTSAAKAAINYADEQAAATSELRARLVQQRQQLKVLQQRLQSLQVTPSSATTPVGKSASNCHTATHKKN